MEDMIVTFKALFSITRQMYLSFEYHTLLTPTIYFKKGNG
jgi:hypothetical protein